MIRFFVVILTVVSVSFAENDNWWSQFDDSELNRLIEGVESNNGDLAAMKETVHQMEAQTDLSRAVLLPVISTSGLYTILPDDSYQGMQQPEGSTFSTGGVYVNAMYSIDSWGKGYYNYKASSYKKQAVYNDLKSFRLKLRVNTARLYFELVFRKGILNIVHKQITAAKEILELTRLRYKTGEYSLLPLLRQEQSVALAEAQMPTAEQNFITTKLNIASISGVSVNSIALAESLPEVDNIENIKEIDLYNRADIKAEQLRVTAAEALYKSAILSHLPTISLNAKAGYDYLNIGSAEFDKTWSIGAAVTVPVFNGLATYSTQASAKAAKQGAKFSLKQKLESVNAEYEIQKSQEQKQLISYKAWLKNKDAALKAFTEAKKQFRQGLTDYLEVLSSLNALTQAEINLLNAHMTLLSSRLKYIELRGGKI